jgi:filamentous hemagglutinin family protein
MRPLALSLACIGALPATAQTLPTVPTIMGGTFGNFAGGNFGISSLNNGGGQLMTVNQTSQRGIVNWQTFSIGALDRFTVVQPSRSAVLLNRVTGGTASLIQGRLTSTLAGSEVPGSGGSVYLINPSGVVFSQGSSVSTGGLIASTLDIAGADQNARNAAFMAGGTQLSFGGNPGDDTSTARVMVQPGATIQVGQGGTVGLIGALVRNEGEINVARGSVGLASGAKVTLDFAGDGLTNFTVPADGLLQTNLSVVQGTKGASPEETALNASTKAQVMNIGTLSADGGRVVLVGGSSLAQQVVNQSGTVRARSLVSRGGQIVLEGVGPEFVSRAGVATSGTLDASAAEEGAAGGSVRVSGGNVQVSGQLLARGQGSGDGGTVTTESVGAGRVGDRLAVDENTVVDAGGGATGRNGLWEVKSKADLAVTNNLGAYTDVSAVSDKAVGGALGRGTDVGITSQAMELQTEPVNWARTGNGVSIDSGAVVEKTQGPGATLTVNSSTGIQMSGAIRSPVGALNVNFNADAQGEPLPDAQAIQQSNAADLRIGTIALQGATIESGGGDIRFYGQSRADSGRAIGALNAPGIQVQDSRIATCAAGSDCSGASGSISLRGEGGTTRILDVLAASGTGVTITGSTVETGTGSITVDGRGGLGSAGLSIFSGEGGATLLRSASGDISLSGSSRSWLATDPSVLAAGSPTGTTTGFGAGTGVLVQGAGVAAGGNLSINGTAGDLSRILAEPARAATVAAGPGGAFAAGNGVVVSDSSLSAGRGRTLEVSGTAGSRGYTFALDGGGNPVPTAADFDAFGVAVVGTPERGLSAEGGAVRLAGVNSDVAVFRTTADEAVGPDGPSRVVSTASSSGPGGTIDIRGRNVLIEGVGGAIARLDSSGAGQAGTVSVRATAQAGNPNSGIVMLGANAVLEANGAGSGNGGRVDVIGDTSLLAYGTIRARGGAAGGNGGAVETSAPTFELAGVRVDASAPAGQAGSWLIDPYDVTIVNGSAAGSLTGNPFVPLADATIQDGDINAALNGGTNVRITTGTGGNPLAGDIFLDDAQINYTGAGARTFTLEANRSIRSNAGTTIASSGGGGPLNVVFSADVNNGGSATGGGQISYSGSIYTNGGNVNMTAAWANASNLASVGIDGAVIDTRGGNQVGGAGYTGGSDALAGGNVSITGRSNVANAFFGIDGVVIDGTRIVSGSGNIDILGTAVNGSGVVIRADQGVGGLFSTTGNISVTGVGGFSASSAYTPGYGVVIGAPPFNAAGQPRIASVDGNIAVRGLRQAGEGTGFGSGPGAGVRVGGNAQLTTAGRGDIEITGEMQGRGAGVEFAPTFSDTFGTQQGGIVSGGRNVVLRAANDGSADALVLGAGSQASAGATMNLRPGGLNLGGTPDAYVATAVDRTANAITVGGAAATGFAVSAAELTRISAPTLVLGSNAQAADITVVGAIDTASALTLQNGAGGNIALNAPVTAPTLGLVSAGNITQTAAAPITAGTLLASSSGGSVLLDQAANNVSAATLGGGAAGAFRYQDVDALRVGNVSVLGYDAAGNLPQVVATGSMAADTVYVRTLSGDLTLATNVSSGSGTDLIAAARFQNAGAFTIAGAPWRVWADTWVGETRGGLAGSGVTPNLYHCAYLGLCTVSISPGDNHFIYAQQPVATVVIGDANRVYGAPNPLFTYSITGLILGDRGLGFSGAPSTTANAFSPPGFYPITGSFSSAEGYLVNVVPGNLRVSVPPSLPLPDVLREVPNTYTFDRNIGAPPICFATGPLGGDRAQQGDDLLAREWSRVRSRPNLTSCIDTERKNGCADF